MKVREKSELKEGSGKTIDKFVRCHVAGSEKRIGFRKSEKRILIG